MDYQGEQDMEIQALEAILMDELQEYEGMVPKEWTEGISGKPYKVVIKPQEEDLQNIDFDVRMDFIFAQSKKYPESEPFINIKSTRGLNQAQVDECLAMLRIEIQANMGISMIYQLITVAKDWIGEKVEEFSKGDEETDLERRKRLDKEEEERVKKRAYGVQVTNSTFQEWKSQFKASHSRQSQHKGAVIQKDPNKLTGKQYFLLQYNKQDELNAEEDKEFSDDDDQDPMDQEGAQHNTGAQQNGKAPMQDDTEDETDEDEDDEEFLEDYLAQKTQT